MGEEDDDLAAEWAAALEESEGGDADDEASAPQPAPAPAPAPPPAQNEPANLGEAVMAGVDPDRVEAVYDIPVEIIAVLGTASMPIAQILKLGRGAVVELERIIGEPIEIHANNRLVARGEVVVVEDRLGVQITEVVRSN